jgi:hypothetical protein
MNLNLNCYDYLHQYPSLKILYIVDAKCCICSAFRITDMWTTNSSQPFLPTEAAASQSNSWTAGAEPNEPTKRFENCQASFGYRGEGTQGG